MILRIDIFLPVRFYAVAAIFNDPAFVNMSTYNNVGIREVYGFSVRLDHALCNRPAAAVAVVIRKQESFYSAPGFSLLKNKLYPSGVPP